MPCCIHLGCRGAGSPPVSCEARLRPPNRSEKVVPFRAGGLAPHPFATAARLWKRLNFPRQPGVGSCQPSLGSTKHGIVRIRAEHQCWNRNQLYGRRNQTDAGLSAGGRQWRAGWIQGHDLGELRDAKVVLPDEFEPVSARTAMLPIVPRRHRAMRQEQRLG